ncbi:hypothetical protein T4C_9308 [Trichinella pseudospiralis]|uniref:Uncharacterized protein n=1 Tax=Trichinella pseudospiralis TaxID=6337 RepID=A0A0V1JRB7_TRIPS|nr:hypothetical protein T4C_9308 [Trichinella pseudospiralis]
MKQNNHQNSSKNGNKRVSLFVKIKIDVDVQIFETARHIHQASLNSAASVVYNVVNRCKSCEIFGKMTVIKSTNSNIQPVSRLDCRHLLHDEHLLMITQMAETSVVLVLFKV